jgi:hypothetical protein
MDEVLGVRRAERSGDLRDDRRGPGGIERPFGLDQRLQIRLLHVSHRDVEDVLRLTGLEDRDHVRMVERSCDPRLALEALAEQLVVCELRGQELERDGLLEGEVLGPVDDAHTAVPDERLQPVSRKFGADPRDPAHPTTSNTARQSLPVKGLALGAGKPGPGRLGDDHADDVSVRPTNIADEDVLPCTSSSVVPRSGPLDVGGEREPCSSFGDHARRDRAACSLVGSWD